MEAQEKTRRTPFFRRPRVRRLLRKGWPLLALLAVLLLVPLGFDRYVVWSTRDRVYTEEEAPRDKVDAILVLGAYVRDDGSLCPMLEDRMTVGVRLYQAGISDTLVLSGDASREGYDEPEAMKQFALQHGVPEQAIVLDKAGLSTYASVYRAKNVGGYRSLAIVSQQYHLYRALYIADALEVQAIGVSSDLRRYWNQFKYDCREILARNKDFWQCRRLPELENQPDTWVMPATGTDAQN